MEESLTSSQLLSSSTSSILGSSRNGSSHIQRTFKQASTLYLTRRLKEALSVLETIIRTRTPLGEADVDHETGEIAPVTSASRASRIKVWSLYLTLLDAIINLGPEEGYETFGSRAWRETVARVRDGGVWGDVVRDGYKGVEGDVDAEIVINLSVYPIPRA